MENYKIYNGSDKIIDDIDKETTTLETYGFCFLINGEAQDDRFSVSVDNDGHVEVIEELVYRHAVARKYGVKEIDIELYLYNKLKKMEDEYHNNKTSHDNDTDIMQAIDNKLNAINSHMATIFREHWRESYRDGTMVLIELLQMKKIIDKLIVEEMIDYD